MSNADIEFHELVHDVHDELYAPTVRRVVGGDPYTVHTGFIEPQAAPVAPAPGLDTADTSGSVTGSEAPPKAGSGSGRDAWAAYAATLGIAVPNDATRDDIIVLTEQHTED